MPEYWMITNRNVKKNGFGDDLAPMTYWSSDKGHLDNFKNWTDKSDGDAIANLTYRVTVLYTGLDTVLGMSAGFKHFGKRRLGRSGLDDSYPIPDNVWDIDCTSFLKKASNVHSAYFENTDTLNLMRNILRGVDRKVITHDLPQI